MADYHLEAPPILQEFLSYHESILSHSAKTVDEYFAYVKAFHCFTKEILNHDSEEFERIRKDFEDACRKEFGNQTNMEVTTVRAIELVLFQIGKSIKDSKKTAKNP